MKLTIAFALVTLTLFCRPASTEVCPSLLYALGNLLIGTPSSYEAALEPFSPDEDMKEATRQLKELIDTLSPKAKDSVLQLMPRAPFQKQPSTGQMEVQNQNQQAPSMGSGVPVPGSPRQRFQWT
ncbi:hypothetical protein JEQ12_011132 [Ovis aries]|uniref:Uteroglobin n=1 Tax=Ovis aries TaxID=9940 RepID=A0A835ZN89_SHEEP|nr:hypothetical protein JEQ12_011132 [Ovis aries]